MLLWISLREKFPALFYLWHESKDSCACIISRMDVQLSLVWVRGIPAYGAVL